MTLENNNIKKLNIDGCFLLYPKLFSDNRGSFHESYNEKIFNKIIKKKYKFVQDNISISKKNVLRGLHIQLKRPQGKLIKVLNGSIFDVFVDLRRKSPTFGKYQSVVLNSSDFACLWLPPGIAHGFFAISKDVILNYKVTEFYYPKNEYTIKWNDKKLNIKWPTKKPNLSKKDEFESISLNKVIKLV